MAKPAKTETATLLVCQCEGSHFTVKKQTRSSVSLVCGKCGLAASVKGHVADAEVTIAELAVARKHLVGPDPDATPSRKGGATLAERGYRALRFRIDMTQSDVIQRALEAVRVMNAKDDPYTGQQWQGAALEYICADFLSGVDPQVLATLDAVEQAEADAAAQAIAAGSKSERALRRARSRARADTLAKATGEPYQPELTLTDKAVAKSQEDYVKAQESKAAAEAADERVVDDGRLLKAVRGTLAEYAEAYKDRNGKPFKLLVDELSMLPTMQAHWQEKGGLLFRIDGDSRTRTKAGLAPSCLLWIEEEDPDQAIDFALEYDDAFDDMVSCPRLTVIEMLPADWEKLPAEEQWESPAIAERREVLP